MRIRKDGKRYIQDLNIQDMPSRAVAPASLIRCNVRTACNLLADNLNRYRGRIPQALENALSALLRDMETILKGDMKDD